MAGTIQVTCPSCKKQLRLGEELQGKKVRCKGCSTVFPAAPENPSASTPPPAAKPAGKPSPIKPAARQAASPPQPKPPVVDDDGPATYGLVDDAAYVPSAPTPSMPPPSAAGDAGKYGVTQEDFKARCPHCTHLMESEDAIVCLNCGYNTRTRTRAEKKRIYETTGQDRFLWLLPGVLHALVVPLAIGLDFFFCYGLASTWEEFDRWSEVPSITRGLRWWFVFFSLFAMFYSGRFAVMRLIIHPSPPEVERKDEKKDEEGEEEEDE